MITIVLDTNVASYLPHLDDVIINVSFMTIAEMHFGAEHASWGNFRRRRLERFLHDFPVIESTPEICHIWARITAACERQGRRILIADAWIAACALRYGFPLVTHNRKDFEAVPDLRIISEND